MLRIKVKGKEYPCEMVMGAFLLFKRETGKDVSQMKQDNLEDLLMLMWCCVKCTTQADGDEFPLDFETFCNSITPAVLNSWNKKISAATEKKSMKKV